MSRIADKHGLTNKYRQTGIGKRVVRRGRPRKYLFGSPKRSNKNNAYYENNLSISHIPYMIGVVFCLFVPFFIPIVVGAILMIVGDKTMKKRWGLPLDNKSMPVSMGWMLLTGLEMLVAFFICIFILIDEATVYALIISVVIYGLLSTLILYRKYKKIKKQTKF